MLPSTPPEALQLTERTRPRIVQGLNLFFGRLVRLSFVVACLMGLSSRQLGAAAPEAPVLEASVLGGTPDQRIAFVGNSTAERMNLFGNLETRLQIRLAGKRPIIRNFGWPADEVAIQKRPGNYNKIDDPYLVFQPNWLICFFGFNESFSISDEESIQKFKQQYREYLANQTRTLGSNNSPVHFVILSPIAFESTGISVQPDGTAENERLAKIAQAVKEIAVEGKHAFVDLLTPTLARFSEQSGAQFTINGVHLNEAGDALVARIIEQQLFGATTELDHTDLDERLRGVINDKSWLHLQDYRMLNGWYVYGGRRTWDTETFPREYQKIRKMVAVRDRYIWDLVTGKSVTEQPDDSSTGEVFIPETMFGTRGDNFRKMREPKTLQYPTPAQSIAQMKVPEGFKVELFASEKDFPELANPTQLAFDSRGRLWVSCMVNYPQWLPGKSRPNDRLLILEDTDGDGKADRCTPFYDKLICPTGFEFYKDGVLVIDEPRIIFLRDTDGDDIADESTVLLDGIGTEDTHHAMGAWEFSPGGLLHMLEGIAMTTTMETPWGPVRKIGAAGSYVWDLESMKIRHFRSPGHANPWCLVFDEDGNNLIGDGTNANQHWGNVLSGAEVQTRRSIDPIFNNEGIRPAAGNELLKTRQFPERFRNQLVYGCVINLHGLPAFEVRDDEESAGLTGERVENLLESTDMFFRPVDPKIGPDGALWFGDWCNALIGHMQYSQRDPNRDHEHGRIYRLVYEKNPLLPIVTHADKSIEELLKQLTAFETRTRYRARRELRARDRGKVLAAVKDWASSSDAPNVWREALWVQESMHAVDRQLVKKVLDNAPSKHRAAAIHVVGNESQHIDSVNELLSIAVQDADARVRMEAVRAASFTPGIESIKIALSATSQPMDKWVDYVLEHTLQALEPDLNATENQETLAALDKAAQQYLREYRISRGEGADVHKPLKTLINVDAKPQDLQKALLEVVAAKRGDPKVGKAVFGRVCAACHQHGELGKKFGPNLTDLGDRMTKHQIIASVVWPNETIAKGYGTVMVLDFDGNITNGFVISENDNEITLGIADGKTKTILKDDIDVTKEMKASSMPEGLTETIAPKEFLDLLAFLMGDWVATNPNLDYPLQKNGELTEVSRQTHLKLGKTFPTSLNKEAEHLLSHEGVRKFTFAFHSPNKKSSNPNVIIRFNNPTKIGVVKVFNRRDAVFHDRAKGITMWVSDDGKEWKEVWHSEEAYPDWSFQLPMDKPIGYAKFGLKHPGILHLDRVVFYGVIGAE